MKIALTVAGSDSGGGAGLQADLKTFHQFGVFGTTVVTAVTAQNTLGVGAIGLVEPEMIRHQFARLAEDLGPHAVKSGMLGSGEIVRTVADAIQEHAFGNYVLDPVMVASSGDRLLVREAESTIRSRLLPLAGLVTPNLDEAEILVEREVRSVSAMKDAGRDLLDLGAGAALIKGGHGTGSSVVDVLVTRDHVKEYVHARLDSDSTHGTGCTLSAAITAGLASGRGLVPSVEQALDFVHRAIATAPALGRGRGPLNHFAPLPGRDGAAGDT